MSLDTYASEKSAAVWAQEEFGQANLGDARRTKRLIRMAASAAQFPSGWQLPVGTQAKVLLADQEPI